MKHRVDQRTLLTGLGAALLVAVGYIVDLSGQPWGIPIVAVGASGLAAVLVSWVQYRLGHDPLDMIARHQPVLQDCAEFDLEHILSDRSSIRAEDTLDLFAHATECVSVLTISHHNWTLHTDLPATLEKASRRCRVRIVVVEPGSDLAGLWDSKDGAGWVQEMGAQLLGNLAPILRSIRARDGDVRVLAKPRDTPFCAIVRADDIMRVTVYLNHLPGGECPTLVFRKGRDGALWRKYNREFETLFDRATPLEDKQHLSKPNRELL